MADESHFYGFYPRGVIKWGGVRALTAILFSRFLRRPCTNLTSTLFWGLTGSDLRH